MNTKEVDMVIKSPKHESLVWKLARKPELVESCLTNKDVETIIPNYIITGYNGKSTDIDLVLLKKTDEMPWHPRIIAVEAKSSHNGLEKAMGELSIIGRHLAGILNDDIGTYAVFEDDGNVRSISNGRYTAPNPYIRKLSDAEVRKILAGGVGG